MAVASGSAIPLVVGRRGLLLRGHKLTAARQIVLQRSHEQAPTFLVTDTLLLEPRENRRPLLCIESVGFHETHALRLLEGPLGGSRFRFGHGRRSVTMDHSVSTAMLGYG